MIHLTDVILSITILSVLLTLGSNRLMALVKIIALQGVLVSLTPLFMEHHDKLTGGILFLTPITVAIKGLVIPAFLFFAVKKASIRREIEPIISYHASLFAGLAMILVSAFIVDRLPLNLPGSHALLLITGITTLAAGLLLMMGRRKGITQVIGYLMLENGIYLIGTALAREVHTLHVLEFGILLDLLAGVMIMGIILTNINRAFDDMDTSLLMRLKD
ncbi:MAG: hydrogenase [Desulfatibacillum sp.]|nr:hydrogenase [Desulfatibacillum sp.]